MKETARRWMRPVLGLAITFFFLWLMFRHIDFSEVGVALSKISLPSLIFALGFLASGYTVRIVRWWWMLRTLDPQVMLSSCAWPFLVSIALNNLLPFRAGDAARVVGFRKQLRAPAIRLLGTLFIERVLDLMTLLGFFFIGLLGVTTDEVPETFIRLTAFIGAVAAAAVLTALLFNRQIKRLVCWIANLPALAKRGWTDPIKQHSKHFLDTLNLLRTPKLTFQLIALSIVVWTFEGAVFATVAHAISPESTYVGSWFALATGTLATLLPSSPGYVGTFDYFAMLGLIAYGAERATAAAFAFVVHVILWLPLTGAGLIYFLLPGASLLRKKIAVSVSTKEESA